MCGQVFHFIYVICGSDGIIKKPPAIELEAMFLIILFGRKWSFLTLPPPCLFFDPLPCYELTWLAS
jgi:hypothetical protein